MKVLDHIQGHTFHGRKGAVENAFRYSIDFVCIDMGGLDDDGAVKTPSLFSRNRFNLAGLYDRDHGGVPKQGAGVDWVYSVLSEHDLPKPHRVELLTQPRFWGHVFNPVSFWLCYDADGAFFLVIAEVTNTFGERHSYLCHRDDLAPLGPHDQVKASKIFYVSPFQKIEGGYTFRFDIRPDRIGVWIDYSNGNQGLIATLVGKRKPASNTSLLWASVRRPLGSRRVQALIFWQAFKLWMKGATYRVRPKPPEGQISR